MSAEYRPHRAVEQQLADMTGADLTSVLMHVFARRAMRQRPSDVMNNMLTNRFLAPAVVPQDILSEIDRIAFESLPADFGRVELSPLAALGSNSVIASIDQKTVVPAGRSAEVMADSVTTLAMLGAAERQSRLRGTAGDSQGVIKLATSHREVRAQHFDPESGFTPHFRAFSLVTLEGGRSGEAFAEKHLLEHLRTYLTILERSRLRGYAPHRVTARVSSMRLTHLVIERGLVDRAEVMARTQDPTFDLFEAAGIDMPRVVTPCNAADALEVAKRLKMDRPMASLLRVASKIIDTLKPQFPAVDFGIDIARSAGVGYYDEFCFKVAATTSDGETYPLADAGMSDWSRRLLARKNEGIVSGGMGTELFARYFSTLRGA